MVFVGGAAVPLWITDPAAPDPRPTLDVDAIVEVETLTAYDGFAAGLRATGFREDAASGVICRWRHPGTSLVLDVMPADPSILGFANRWYRDAARTAATRVLSGGVRVRVVSPPYLLATKVEAFLGRGRGDLLASRDVADVIALFDGRPELPGEVAAADPALRAYLARHLADVAPPGRAGDVISAHLPPDGASQARVPLIQARLDGVIAGT